MTEAEWLSSREPDDLLKWLQKSKRHRPSRRKLILFAVACASRVEAMRAEPLSSRGLQLAEDLAEGRAGTAEHREFMRQAIRAGNPEVYAHMAIWAVRIWEPENWTSPEGAARSAAGYAAMHLPPDEPARQCDLLRDVIGNPYRPVTFSPNWRTDTAVSLADRMYESREFSAMPILADALQDAGCETAAILDHCRGSGPHVRGCWVVDLVLGKA